MKILLLLLSLSFGLFPKDVYRASVTDVKVLGTSNLHDWSMESKDVSCSGDFTLSPGGESLSDLSFSLPVRNLKSGESLMDSRAYDALGEDKFATIQFVQTAAVVTPEQAGHFRIKSTGNLSIRGVTRQEALDAVCVVNPDGSLSCTGAQKIKMTDFGIKPPVFMLGTLRCGDDLTIEFTLNFKK